MTYYVVIRGPLGVGKSTVARALAKRIRGVVVSIDALTDRDWDGGSVRLFVRANARAAFRARRLLGRGRPVVFDGCFYWKTQISDLERRLPFPHRIFTLMAPLPVCVARDAHRRRSFGAEAARAVHAKVRRFQSGRVVDNTRERTSALREILADLPPA